MKIKNAFINAILKIHHESYSSEENLPDIDDQKDLRPPFPMHVFSLFEINFKKYMEFLKKNAGFLVHGINNRSPTTEKNSAPDAPRCSCSKTDNPSGCSK